MVWAFFLENATFNRFHHHPSGRIERHGDWPSAATTVFCKLVDCGFPYLAAIALVVCGWTYALKPEGLRAIAHDILNARWFAVGGWILSGGISMGSWKLIGWMDRNHRAEIERFERRGPLATQGRLDLDSSGGDKQFSEG